MWFNTTHMHLRTHPKPESVGQAGRWQSPYHDTMIDHDKVVGALLDQLDELGLAEDTIVVYSTDNGPHMNTWPDGGMTPFRSEKNTNWEGAFRVPQLIRWPGRIAAGRGLERDRQPPRLAADASSPRPASPISWTSSRRVTRSVTGPTRCTSTATTCCPTSPARSTRARDRGSSTSPTTATCWRIRFDNWKLVFMEQRVAGDDAGLGRAVRAVAACRSCSTCAWTRSSAPTSPRTPIGTGWWTTTFLVLAAQTLIAQFLATFAEFPPRQKAASFTIDQALEKMEAAITSGR